MNKIINGTYLYSELLNRFKEEISEIIILNKAGKVEELDNNINIFFIYPEIIENVLMYKDIFNQKGRYIIYGDFSKVKIKNKLYINLLNIGDEYNLYVCLRRKIDKNRLKRICIYTAIFISDIVIVNKIKNIDEGMQQLDIALDLGKDIYAIPGDIFQYENYLANYAIKQGAIPICSRYDAKYILEEKKSNVL